jgi:hypothetical protein
MIFIETPTFTRLIVELLDDDEYSKLQTELAKHPDAGDLIKNGGGIRRFAGNEPGQARAVAYGRFTTGSPKMSVVS